MAKFLIGEIVQMASNKHLYGYTEIGEGHLVQVLMPISGGQYLVYCDYLDWQFTVHEDEVRKVEE